MITVSRAKLRLLSISIGLLFTAAIYYTMHNNPRWDWSAPGVGRLPQAIVHSFLHEAYDLGRGGAAARDYFAADARDNAPGAQDRRDGSPFDAEDARRRIRAQVDTLREAGVRHVVFGAFGCGAFENPADKVAAIYRDELHNAAAAFDVVAFAIFHAGYGPGNHAPFAQAFEAAQSRP